MRKTMMTAALATTLAVMPTGAWSRDAYVRGEDLNTYCQQFLRNRLGQGRNQFFIGFCIGYALGSADQLSRAKTICIPEDITAGEVGEVVAEFIDQNPVMRELPGVEITLSALVRAYPCLK
jgi:hypothetical protein